MSTPKTTKSRIPLMTSAIISDAQLGEFLGVSDPDHLSKLIAKIPHRKLGRTRLISVQQLWDHLGKGEVQVTDGQP